MIASSLSFARALLLPALMVFVLPAFAVWFAGHAERSYDQDFLANVLPQVDKDAELTPEDRQKARAFYQEMPPSVACFDDSPEFASYRAMLEEGCSDYRQFAYSRLAAVIALAVGALAMLLALCCSLLAFFSRPMQYLSFLLGWNVLKVVGAIETVLQGGLLVWLSFWMTALWTEKYFVKLVLVAACLAGVAAFKVIVAIFARPGGAMDVEGERLTEQGSPELWARVRQLCAQLGTSAPDHIIVGIDDNFFVTEHEVQVGGELLTGRVLYVSLSLLRSLQRSEADAVLAHEMAHLLGGDTGHSKKLSPLTARFSHYLAALHEGLVTRPIFYFMRAYMGVFQLSVSRSRRAAEFAADAVAARVTSASDVARALVKVGAYSSYRGRVEEELFGHQKLHTDVGIAARVATGFTSYAQTEALHFDLHESVTPHPFDSHPQLRQRIAKVGCELAPAEYEAVLVEGVSSSWVDAIPDAAAIEARLWEAYEQRFAAAHDLALAYRYQPANDEERAHVERHFPALVFTGTETVRIDHAEIHYDGWDTPVKFEEISSASVEDRMFKKYLDLKLKDGGLFKKRSICLSKQTEVDALLAAFNRYYGRHQMMVRHLTQGG